jgi:hypothetical protein
MAETTNSSAPGINANNSITVGGETYKGSEDYLRTINGLFNRIAGISFSNAANQSAISWDLNYCTDMLINSILDPKDRAELRKAKVWVYQAECRKLSESPEKYKSFDSLAAALKEAQLTKANVNTCLAIVGEVRTYLDKYFGLEKKLAVFTGDD